MTASDFNNLCSIKNLILRLFMFKRLFNYKYFDTKFMEAHPEFKPDRVIEELLHILSLALPRLAEIYKALQTENPDSHLNDHLHIVSLIVQVVQEIFVGHMMNDKLGSEIGRVSLLC